MNLLRKFITCSSCFFIIITVSSHNKNKDDMKDKIEAVYMFGTGINLSDSIVYMTPIIKFNGVKTQPLLIKDKFLYHRSIYSSQLKEYLKKKERGITICTTFFSKKRNGAEKKYAEVKKHMIKTRIFKIKNISTDKFKYKPVKE